jgi:hypothetical protein
MDIGQGAKQAYLGITDPAAAKEYTKQTDEEIAAYEKGRGPNAGFDGFRLGGATLGSIPAAHADVRAATPGAE